jgi:hypothetical protein
MLQKHWTSVVRNELHGKLAKSLQTYKRLTHQLELLRAEIDLRALSTANVVGFTTSGLARNLAMLRRLPSKVLLSEEAGEVLEAHLITAMLPNLQHVILIGDHLQLRPQVQNYELSSESANGEQYSLDISLFERLVKPLTAESQPLPFTTLETQRRMHPSISNLIRSTLYPDLLNARNVFEYPEVAGMRRRLFWLDHGHFENTVAESQSTSKINEWEVDMTTALVCHIVRQGVYKPSEIAVLSPYLGQVKRLRDKLNSFYEITLSEGDATVLGELANSEDGNSTETSSETSEQEGAPSPNVTCDTLTNAVRLSTIDNFQGEEAKVVIISLVRCNQQCNPGFLRTEDRCNVLLSRTKHGMYIIGDSRTAGSAQMWSQVISMLQPESIGGVLQLSCSRHPEKVMEVSEPDDISNSHQRVVVRRCVYASSLDVITSALSIATPTCFMRIFSVKRSVPGVSMAVSTSTNALRFAESDVRSGAKSRLSAGGSTWTVVMSCKILRAGRLSHRRSTNVTCLCCETSRAADMKPCCHATLILQIQISCARRRAEQNYLAATHVRRLAPSATRPKRAR